MYSGLSLKKIRHNLSCLFILASLGESEVRADKWFTTEGQILSVLVSYLGYIYYFFHQRAGTVHSQSVHHLMNERPVCTHIYMNTNVGIMVWIMYEWINSLTDILLHIESLFYCLLSITCTSWCTPSGQWLQKRVTYMYNDDSYCNGLQVYVNYDLESRFFTVARTYTLV